MKVRLLASASELAEARPVWNDVVGDCPLHSWQWLHTWWETLGSDRELLVLTAEQDGKLIGLLPLCRQRQLASGKVLTFLGSGKACTEYLSLFASDDVAPTIAQEFAAWLARNQSQWDQIDLENVRSDDTNVGLLLSALESNNSEISAIDGDPCWRIELPSSHEEYVASLSKRLRRKLRDAFRKVIETDAFSVETVSDEGVLKSMFEQFVELHVRRREAIDGDHCFRFDQFNNFLSLAAERLLECGILDMSCCKIDNVVATVLFGLKNRNGIYLYQTGMNPDLQHLSPGWTMNCYRIELCFREGLQFYDLLRGNEQYKSHLGAKPVKTTHYRVAAAKTTAKIRHQIWKTKQTMRSWRSYLSSDA